MTCVAAVRWQASTRITAVYHDYNTNVSCLSNRADKMTSEWTQGGLTRFAQLVLETASTLTQQELNIEYVKAINFSK